MLWHGGAALKQVERDVEHKLGYSYVQKAKRDSKVCDLMISGCRANTELIRRSFWYSGEILEEGIPRNDMFFNGELHANVRRRIFDDYNLVEGSRIVLYAPTFRSNGSLEPYRIDWGEVVPRLEQMFGGERVTVFLRLHPNLLRRANTASLINHPSVVDVTRYHDMQELLCISDMLITDYSSSMFDFAMLNRPCLLYATDVEEYDRGYYYDFRELPFPLARNIEELKALIEKFDEDKYKSDLELFLKSRLGLKERGVASKALAEWMQNHSIASPK
jgi:CDP-glycerol glycerophosphotransferase